MKKLLCLLAPFALGFTIACPEPEPSEGEGEGEGEPDPPCFIGDEVAPAELELVFRTVDGQIEKLDDGEAIPLILPVQGGKVVYVGVRGRNVTCRVQVTAGLKDICQDPPAFIHVESRAVLLEDDGTGLAVPVNDPSDIVVSNLANVAMCPSFVTSVDVNQALLGLELSVREQPREGEDGPRVHSLTSTVMPFCGEEENMEDCDCECDADFSIDSTKAEQCPTINDNDLPPGECQPD